MPMDLCIFLKLLVWDKPKRAPVFIYKYLHNLFESLVSVKDLKNLLGNLTLDQFLFYSRNPYEKVQSSKIPVYIYKKCPIRKDALNFVG